MMDDMLSAFKDAKVVSITIESITLGTGGPYGFFLECMSPTGEFLFINTSACDVVTVHGPEGRISRITSADMVRLWNDLNTSNGRP